MKTKGAPSKISHLLDAASPGLSGSHLPDTDHRGGGLGPIITGTYKGTASTPGPGTRRRYNLWDCEFVLFTVRHHVQKRELTVSCPEKKKKAAVFLIIVGRALTITTPTQNSCLKEVAENLL